LQKEVNKLERKNARARAYLEELEKNNELARIEPSPVPGKCFIEWGRPQLFPELSLFDEDEMSRVK
jgi:hypothetical protein